MTGGIFYWVNLWSKFEIPAGTSRPLVMKRMRTPINLATERELQDGRSGRPRAFRPRILDRRPAPLSVPHRVPLSPILSRAPDS